MKKSLVSTLMTLSLALITVGCSTYQSADAGSMTQTSDEAGAEDYKELTIGTSGEILTLDTNKSNDSYSAEVLYHTSEGLLRLNDKEVVPGLAESYEESEDKTTYTFHLREANWEDGEPITAHDFVYSFQRFFDPNTGAPEVDLFLGIKNAEAINQGEITDLSQLGVVALDEKTLQITLEEPSVLFISHLAETSKLYPLRQEYVEAAGEKYGTDSDHFLASGPFKVSSWASQSEIVYEKNENYWDAERINLDKINRVIIADANTRVSMYDNEEIDINIDVPALSTSNYSEEEVFSAPVGTTVTLQFNLDGMTEETGKVLSNVNFRKALSYAIDRSAVVNAIAGSSNTPAGRFIDPVVPGVEDTYANEYPIDELPLTADAAKAKAYLDKALEELNMTTTELPTFTYVCMESSTYKLFAEAMLDSWKSVLGLECFDVKQYPIPTAITNMLNGEYDLYWQKYSADLNDPYEYLSAWVADGSINVTGWKDDFYSELIESTNTIFEPSERLAVFAEAEAYLLDNGPQVPIYYAGNYFTVSPHVSGITYGKDLEYLYADVE